jgi:transposase
MDLTQYKLIKCPTCGAKVHGHGTRRRIVRILGEKKWCKVRRFLCTGCKKTFTRLPDFLIPFKHYVVREIEHFLRSLVKGPSFNQAETGAEESTLRRWQREFHGKMQSWAGELESKAQEYFKKQIHLLDIPSHPLLRLEQAVDHFPELPSRWRMLVKALHWLNRSHPLCIQ